MTKLIIFIFLALQFLPKTLLAVDTIGRVVARRLATYGCYCYSIFNEEHGKVNLNINPVDDIDQLCLDYHLSKNCLFHESPEFGRL